MKLTPFLDEVNTISIDECRPEIQFYARAMEAKLRRHDAERGSGLWRSDDPADLLQHAIEEIIELRMALVSGTPNEVFEEGPDVGNMAMMVIDAAACLYGMPDGISGKQ